MKRFINKIKQLFIKGQYSVEIYINDVPIKKYIYHTKHEIQKGIKYEHGGIVHSINYNIHEIDSLYMNKNYDINYICGLINKYKDNYLILDKIGIFVKDNKYKFSLSNLLFIGEYLNDYKKRFKDVNLFL